MIFQEQTFAVLGHFKTCLPLIALVPTLEFLNYNLLRRSLVLKVYEEALFLTTGFLLYLSAFPKVK